MKRADLERTLFELRYDMDLIGEPFDISEELRDLSDSELLKMVEEYSE